MDENNKKKRGGRPKKPIRASIIKKFRVTDAEDRQLRKMAEKHHLTVTAYVKTFALTGKLIVKHKQVSQEMIAAVAILKNIGQNINSLAHKNNRGDFLNEVDKEDLLQQLNTLMEKTNRIENYFYDSED